MSARGFHHDECGCGDPAGEGYCLACHHPVCDPCALGAGGIVKSCPACGPDDQPRPCYICKEAESTIPCDECRNDHCGHCWVEHPCQNTDICRYCGYFVANVDALNVETATPALPTIYSHNDACPGKWRCSNCKQYYAIVGAPLHCVDEECPSLACIYCCPDILLPANTGICMRHYMECAMCACCGERRVHRVLGANFHGLVCCNKCWPRVEMLYKCLRRRIGMDTSLVRCMVALAILTAGK